MSTVFEIAQLENGDVVLREADDEGEPLVLIRFSEEVKDMLGEELLAVAEAMIDAATDFVGAEPQEHEEQSRPPAPPVIH